MSVSGDTEHDSSISVSIQSWSSLGTPARDNQRKYFKVTGLCFPSSGLLSVRTQDFCGKWKLDFWDFPDSD